MDYEKISGGMLNYTSEFIPPKTGECGPHVCRSCGYNFNHKGNRNFFDIFRSPFVKCPKCGSLITERDPRWHY